MKTKTDDIKGLIHTAMGTRHLDILVFIFFLILVPLLKVPILHLPYNWDEMGAYMTPSHWLFEGSLLRTIPGTYPATVFFGHPPAIYLSIAFLFKIAGDNIWVAHTFVIIISFIGVYFTYLLGRELFDVKTGLVASMLLFSSPLYFAQSGMVHANIFLSTFGVMAVYFALRRQYTAYLLSSLYLVFAMESGVAIVVAILLYHLLPAKNRPRRFSDILKLAVPNTVS